MVKDALNISLIFYLTFIFRKKQFGVAKTAFTFFDFLKNIKI
jgi:hypothetical protein